MAAQERPTPRADPAGSAVDFVHTGPGSLAGRYLRQYWQPVYRAHDLPVGQARPLQVLGEAFTLYRGASGAAHLVAYRCAHRGTQLSVGWVEDDCLRCFYHGWKYDGAGQCVEMPAEAPGFAAKVRIASYPVEEYLGLLFAYLGEGEPPPLPRYPAFEGPGVRIVGVYTRRCNTFQDLENMVNGVHVAFVHRRSMFQGYALDLNWLQPLLKIQAWKTGYGLVERITVGTMWSSQIHFVLPNIFWYPPFRSRPEVAGEANGASTDLIVWRVPVDDVQHCGFSVSVAHVSAEAMASRRDSQQAFDATAEELAPPSEVAAEILAGRLQLNDVPERGDLTEVEDHVAQVGQGEIADRTHERLGRTDVGVILLREMWSRELEAFAGGRPVMQLNQVDLDTFTS